VLALGIAETPVWRVGVTYRYLLSILQLIVE
jgi:hypothetical protein